MPAPDSRAIWSSPTSRTARAACRDLHTLFWIGKFIYAVKDAPGLVEKGVFNRSELRRFEKCEDFLWAVRCHMHFLRGRRQRQLTFDIQNEIAQRFGYTAHGGLRAVERFMKHYFLIAKDVGDLTRDLLLGARGPADEARTGPVAILRPFATSDIRAIGDDPDFRLDAGRLTVADNGVFSRHPVNLVRLFHVADRNNLTIHPDAFTPGAAVAQAGRTRPCGRIQRPTACSSASSPARAIPEAILRRMNEAGVLGRFIPPFGRIVAMMQFNMYHHYTVDEHLMRAVGILAEIEAGALRRRTSAVERACFPRCRRRAAARSMSRYSCTTSPRAGPENHSSAGEQHRRARSARGSASAPAETETVAWLVRHHLLMSETAQMRDLNDFKTILDFAAIVQSLERLKLLLILTVADIRAVGPGRVERLEGPAAAHPLFRDRAGACRRPCRRESRRERVSERPGRVRRCVARSGTMSGSRPIWRAITTAYWLAGDDRTPARACAR